MPKRWSKLEKKIRTLTAKNLPLRIHCTEIEAAWDVGSLQLLGRFQVTLNKEIIWDFPKSFVTYWTQYPDGGNHYSYSVTDINRIIREYIDTPRDQLLKKSFPRDYFGIVDILRASDRRIATGRLIEHYRNDCPTAILKILAYRHYSNKAVEPMRKTDN